MSERRPDAQVELKFAPTLRGNQRRGIARLYRDAVAELGADPQDPAGLETVDIEGKVTIKPYEWIGSEDSERLWLPSFWIVHVTDEAAPDCIRNEWIYIANDEISRSEWVFHVPPDHFYDPSQPRNATPRVLETETATALIDYLRDLPPADGLRELT